ncbi:hypothetical protein OUZ56_013620 [Daphnia magna]|uniref:Uncharacterized protein n=1 Tax=Daphnia magna TaxID=35525 RepID=A0ABQ9Z6F4_9CRUS|nr:hypothetical protein OUZ56_013620 [Daphnia magna]
MTVGLTPECQRFSVCISRPSTEVPAYICLFIGQPVTLSGDSIKKSFAVEYGKGMRNDGVDSVEHGVGGSRRAATATMVELQQQSAGTRNKAMAGPRSDSRNKCKQNNNGKRQSKQLYQ